LKGFHYKTCIFNFYLTLPNNDLTHVLFCSLCHLVPGLSKLLLPRINPLALIAFAGGFMLTITYVLIDTKYDHLTLQIPFFTPILLTLFQRKYNIP